MDLNLVSIHMVIFQYFFALEMYGLIFSSLVLNYFLCNNCDLVKYFTNFNMCNLKKNVF